MKKYATLKNVIKAGAVVFGLVAFFLMFANQIYAELLGKRGYVSFSDAMFGDYGAVITFIGYLLILISTLAVCASIFVEFDDMIKKVIDFGGAFLLVLGAIFVFIEASVVNGNVGGSIYHLAAAPVFAGIFAIIAACAIVLSAFVKDKQLL